MTKLEGRKVRATKSLALAENLLNCQEREFLLILTKPVESSNLATYKETLYF